jgi:hypothetical protein
LLILSGFCFRFLFLRVTVLKSLLVLEVGFFLKKNWCFVGFTI